MTTTTFAMESPSSLLLPLICICTGALAWTGDAGGGGGGDVSLRCLDTDVRIQVNQTQQVTFLVRSPSYPVTLSFNTTEPHVIVPVDPVVVPAGARKPSPRDVRILVDGSGAGKTVLVAEAEEGRGREGDKSNEAFVRVSVVHSAALGVLADVVGWLYFVAWSVSFYPQIYENWKRKSVIGLNFDFLSLNVVGFFLYSVFNIGLLWVRPIQAEYFADHPYGVNPVRLNDVIFSLHAVFACAVTIAQCFIYERGNQSVSRSCRLLHLAIWGALAAMLVMAACSAITWLDFLYACSYAKLLITLVKYVPQAVMNYRRKSTMGWSIGNVLLDFSGGILSITQMFMLAYNSDDWSSIFGDPTKFGLGFFSVLFDVFFMLQHYVFYRNAAPHEELLSDLGEEAEDSEEHDRMSHDSQQ